MNTRFPKDSMSVISAMDCLALRDLSFVSNSELSNYGTEKLDVLIDHYGEQKRDEYGTEHGPFIDKQDTKTEYELLKKLLLQQKT